MEDSGTPLGLESLLPPEQIVRKSLEGAGCLTCGCVAALDTLVTENQRLREALQDIADAKGDGLVAFTLLSVARVALEPLP